MVLSKKILKKGGINSSSNSSSMFELSLTPKSSSKIKLSLTPKSSSKNELSLRSKHSLKNKINDYIYGTKTGNDFIYNYPFQIKKNDILDNITCLYNNQYINYNIDFDICKIILNLLEIDIDIDFNYNYKKSNQSLKNLSLKKLSLKNLKSVKSFKGFKSIKKLNKFKKTAGSMYFNYSNLSKYFLKNNYIFDNKHDFGDKDIDKDYLYKENDIDTYSDDKIIKDELKLLFKKKERDIFYNLISKELDITTNILYFSIFDFIDVKNPEIIGQSIFKDISTSDIITLNIEKFIDNFLNTDNSKFISDANLTSGSIDKNLNSTLSRLGLSSSSLFTDLITYKNDYENLVKKFNEYINKKRIITVEDCYDSAPLDIEAAKKFIEKYKDNNVLNEISYINKLINDDINIIDIEDNLKNIFKSFNIKTQSLFTIGYYKYNEIINTAFIFKNKEIITNILTNITNITNLNYLFKLKKIDNYYEKVDNDDFDYYAFDLLNNRNFNSINNIINMINDIVDKIKSYETLELFLKNNLKLILKSNTFNFIIIIYIYLSLINSIPFEELHKEVVLILFDLKKTGDLSKVLFVFYYNYLNNKSPSTIKNIKENNIISNNLHFSSNDKLTALSSILRKSNNVFFADATNFSICIYNNNKDDNVDIKKIFNWFNIYFGNILISSSFNLFENIKNKLSTFSQNNNTNYIIYLNNLICLLLNNISFTLEFKKNKDNIIISSFNNQLDNILSNNNILDNDKININDNINKIKEIIININVSLNLNNYIKLIFIIYLEEVKNNFQNNFKSAYIINYFTEKILFSSINLDITNIYYSLFETIVKKFLNNILENFILLFDTIIKKIDTTTIDFTNSDNIFDILKKLNSIIKIVEIFLFKKEDLSTEKRKSVDSSSSKIEKNISISNMFDFFEDLEKYIKNIIFYKYSEIEQYYNIFKKPPSKLNLFDIIRPSSTLYSDLKNSVFDDIKIEEKINSISKIYKTGEDIYRKLFNGINIINYIIIFQKYYTFFDLLLNDFKFLNDNEDLDKEFNNNIINFINSIKKLYYYSYLQIYTLGYDINSPDNNISNFLDTIKTTLNKIIISIASDKNPLENKKIILSDEIINENINKGKIINDTINSKIEELKDKISLFSYTINIKSLNIENHKNIIILKTDIPNINSSKGKSKTEIEQLKISLDTIFKNIPENKEIISFINDLLETNKTYFNLNDDNIKKIEDINKLNIIKKIINIHNYLIYNEEPPIPMEGIEEIIETASPMQLGGRNKKINVINILQPLKKY